MGSDEKGPQPWPCLSFCTSVSCHSLKYLGRKSLTALSIYHSTKKCQQPSQCQVEESSVKLEIYCKKVSFVKPEAA